MTDQWEVFYRDYGVMGKGSLDQFKLVLIQVVRDEVELREVVQLGIGHPLGAGAPAPAHACGQGFVDLDPAGVLWH